MKKIKDPELFSLMRAFLEEYLPIIRKKSNHTVQGYREALRLFTDFMKVSIGISMSRLCRSDFNKTNIMAFLVWLKEIRGNKDSTINQRLMAMRGFCRYLAGEDATAYACYMDIQEIAKLPVPDTLLDDVLTIEDMELLLRLPDTTNLIGIRDRFYIAVVYDSACRNQEILGARLGDIQKNKKAGSLRVVGKGKKTRIIPLSAEVIKLFEQYSELFHPLNDPSAYLFYIKRKNAVNPMSADNAARILNKYEGIARKDDPAFPHLYPHLLRHARALHLYKAGMPLSLVSQWLGHVDLETSLIYAHADTEMKQDAIDKLVTSKTKVFADEPFKYRGDEEVLRRLAGL